MRQPGAISVIRIFQDCASVLTKIPLILNAFDRNGQGMMTALFFQAALPRLRPITEEQIAYAEQFDRLTGYHLYHMRTSGSASKNEELDWLLARLETLREIRDYSAKHDDHQHKPMTPAQSVLQLLQERGL